MSEINYWWATASDRGPDHWHWKTFFNDPLDRNNFVWSGTESTVSWARIKEMRKGDVIVAYQAGEGVMGFAFLARGGYQHGGDEGNFDSFELASDRFIELENDIPYAKISVLPMANENFEFLRIKLGTVFGVTPRGFKDLVRLAKEWNPNQIPAIDAVLRYQADALRATPAQ